MVTALTATLFLLSAQESKSVAKSEINAIFKVTFCNL